MPIVEIQNFRQKYPDYNDLDDVALAQRLADKYPDAYGDLPAKVKPSAKEEKPKSEPLSLKSAAKLVAPYARPVLEYGGLAAGATLAAPVNLVAPGVASVAGAGLGYAAGRQGANLLEEYAGLRKPEGTIPGLVSGAKDVGEGAMMETGGQLIGKGIQAGGKYLADSGLAEKLYGSAVKAPLLKKWVQVLPGKELSQRESAIKAGIELKAPPSEYGLEVAKKAEREVRGFVDTIIDEGAIKGTVVTTDTLINKGLKKAYERATHSSDPVAAKDVIDKIADGIRQQGPSIKVDDLNTLKRQLYDEVKWGGTETTALTGQISQMSKKGIAHEAMTKLEALYPELQSLNKKDGAYINLIETLERTVGREANKNLVGLGTKVLIGKESWPLAIMNATLGHPHVKARLSFAISRANSLTGKTITRPLGYVGVRSEDQPTLSQPSGIRITE